MGIKNKVAISTALALLISGSSFAANPAPPKPVLVNIFVNDAKLDTYDKEVKKDLPALIIDGRTLMPLKKTFELFGLQITWTEKTQTIETTTAEGTKITLQIGNRMAKVGTKTYKLDVAPQVINGRTYVPVAFVAQAVGHPATWDAKNKVVRLYTDGSEVVNVAALPSVYSKTFNRVNGTIFFDGSEGKMIAITKFEIDFSEVVKMITDTQGIQLSDFTMIQNDKNAEISRFADTFSGMPRAQYVVEKSGKVYLVEIRGLATVEADKVAKLIIK